MCVQFAVKCFSLSWILSAQGVGSRRIRQGRLPAPLLIPGARERRGCGEGKVTRRGRKTEGRSTWKRETGRRARSRTKYAGGKGRKVGGWQRVWLQGGRWAKDALTEQTRAPPPQLPLPRPWYWDNDAEGCRAVPFPSPEHEQKENFLAPSEAEERCCARRGKELGRAREPEPLGCPVRSWTAAAHRSGVVSTAAHAEKRLVAWILGKKNVFCSWLCGQQDKRGELSRI